MSARLKQCLEEYSSLAKQYNLTALAVSALIRKLMIANTPSEDFDKNIVAYVKTALEIRFQKLFVELVDLHKRLCDSDSNFNLEMAMVALLKDIEALDEVDEAVVSLYETGAELQGQISRLAKVNVIELVKLVRTSCEKQRFKAVDLLNFLESRLEQKLHLSVLAID